MRATLVLYLVPGEKKKKEKVLTLREELLADICLNRIEFQGSVKTFSGYWN